MPLPGKTMMTINKETMNRAVQHYLDTLIFQAPSLTVTDVKADRTNYGETFTVDLEPKPEMTGSVIVMEPHHES